MMVAGCCGCRSVGGLHSGDKSDNTNIIIGDGTVIRDRVFICVVQVQRTLWSGLGISGHPGAVRVYCNGFANAADRAGYDAPHTCSPTKP